MRDRTRLRGQNWKELDKELLAEPDFVKRRVAPLLPELPPGCESRDWTIEILRSGHADWIPLRYTFDSRAVIYGRAYFDSSTGRATYCLLARLWNDGCAGSGLQIPEPLAFIDEGSLLLMRGAEGTPLSKLAGASSLAEAVTATRAAAAWLAKYHGTQLPGLRMQSPCERIGILEISDVLANVAAECSGSCSLLIGMLHDLQAIAPKSNSSFGLVPLHGDFRPAHVFMKGSHATVAGLEYVGLSDPAKDVASFLHDLTTCFEQAACGQGAEELVREFLVEYEKLAPSPLQNLAYFRALLAFKSLAKLLTEHALHDDDRQAIGQRYRDEFEQATRRGAMQTAA
jgi:aminoglycoside phosphotransferase (APT) family kinase protein